MLFLKDGFSIKWPTKVGMASNKPLSLSLYLSLSHSHTHKKFLSKNEPWKAISAISEAITSEENDFSDCQ